MSRQIAHPLDPLTGDEFRIVRSLLADERGVDKKWRFASVELIEPSKEQVASFDASGPRPLREASAVVFNTATNSAYRARIDLDTESVTGFDDLPGVQPNITVDEWEEANDALLANPEIIAELERRGITDLSLVFFDTWAYGDAVTPEEYRDRRVGWTDTWVRATADGNPYAGPVNGLHVVIDLNSMELLRIENDFEVPRPKIMGEYLPHLVPGLEQRTDRKPLEITQPEGASFTVDGHLLKWQNWSIRLGFNYREGLVLHNVSYNDHGKERSVAGRLSFSEMVVPYRDPSPDHYRRTAFDIGEWGLGFMTTSLELGCDCLGEISYLDAELHDSHGEPYTIKNAVCLHEEDAGILWKHIDHNAGAESRRMRRFVVSFHCTVANYEYLVYWRFYEDGNIECEVRATGIMVVSHIEPGQAHPNGSLIDNLTYAPFHQHFIVARLDLDIDEGGNTVVASETVREPISESNPYGVALRQSNVPIRTEEEGKQDFNWETQRAWKVVNPNVKTGIGLNPSYKLVPGGAIPAMFDPASPVFRRAEVIGHTVWVTPNDRDERWPAGEFVNQGGAGMGLPEWTAGNRSVENTDVVLWYTFGIHHITRPEDWPMMPSDIVSFWLKPVGFFDRNPSLDVAPQPEDHCAPGAGGHGHGDHAGHDHSGHDHAAHADLAAHAGHVGHDAHSGHEGHDHATHGGHVSPTEAGPDGHIHSGH